MALALFTASRQMDVALYVGLTVACIVIGGLGFFLARLVQRKGRDHSLYSMARSGKLYMLYTPYIYSPTQFILNLRGVMCVCAYSVAID